MADGVDPLIALAQGPVAFADDTFLHPVRENDGLLAYDYEEEDEPTCDLDMTVTSIARRVGSCRDVLAASATMEPTVVK